MYIENTCIIRNLTTFGEFNNKVISSVLLNNEDNFVVVDIANSNDISSNVNILNYFYSFQS